MNPTMMIAGALGLISIGWFGALWTQGKFPPQIIRITYLLLALVVVGGGVSLLAIVFLPSLSGQSSAPSYYDVEQGASMPLATQAARTGLAMPAPQAERLIIRNGSARLVVTDTHTARTAIEALVTEMANEGAFVVSVAERGSGQTSPIINMQIRVPAVQFDNVMARLSALAVRVDDRTETAEDVTAEYVDLEARVTSLEAARDRLRDIMENAATTEELLQAEQQLAQREAEIEALKGRMQYLEQSARLSAISLELWPDVVAQPLDNAWRPAETARRAVDGLIESLKDFADFLIVFTIAWLPWLLLWGVVIWGGWRVFRRWRARPSVPQPPPPPLPPSSPPPENG